MSPERGKSAPAKEKSTTKADREGLLTALATNINDLRANLVFAANWGAIEPHLDLVSMVGILSGGSALSDSQLDHLRKMTALQAGLYPKAPRVPGGREFWELLQQEIGPELETVRSFPEDFQGIPRRWKNALDDVAKLQLLTSAAEAIEPNEEELLR